MRLMPKIIAGTLIAFAWTSLASAETSAQPSIELGEFAHATEMRLDDEIEKTVSRASDAVLSGLSGPSSMSCSHAVTMTELETCVVTANGSTKSGMPAALAHY